MAKINGNRYEEYTREVDELIQQTLEAGWVLSAECDAGSHGLCEPETPEECWCSCHEQE